MTHDFISYLIPDSQLSYYSIYVERILHAIHSFPLSFTKPGICLLAPKLMAPATNRQLIQDSWLSDNSFFFFFSL